MRARRLPVMPLLTVVIAALACGLPAALQPASTPITLKIISDMPMSGAYAADGQAIINAERMRLEQANRTACGGKYSLDFEAWGDGNGLSNGGDSGVEAANARQAAADPAVVAYLGPYNGVGAADAIPILNRNGPLVMISPSASYPGLTEPGQGSAGEPDRYYPSGVRNLARVVSPYNVEGTVAARFVRDQLGAKTVFVLDDQEAYGELTAGEFEATARLIGLQVVGHGSLKPNAGSYVADLAPIAKSNHGRPPDVVYLGMSAENNFPQVLNDKVAVLGDNDTVRLIGPSALSQRSSYGFYPNVIAGIYVTSIGLPTAQLPASGRKFYADYTAKYGKANDFNAIYGYDAMGAALQAIENVCAAGGDPTNRGAVRDAVFSLKNFDGARGTWSFDANGDTTLTDATIYHRAAGQYQPVAVNVMNQITAIK